MLKFIKTSDGRFVGLNGLSNAAKIKYIYTPDGKKSELGKLLSCLNAENAEIISDESVFTGGRRGELAKIVKKAFNPLLKVQNTLFITEENEAVFEAPQAFVRLYENSGAIEEFINGCGNVGLAENLVNYTVTKDLRFMNALTGHSFDLSAFKLCEEFLNEPENSAAKLRLTDAIICGGIKNSVLLERENRQKESKRRIRKAIGGGRRKNVVFIHLESVSQLIFNTNASLFTNISEIFAKSVMFSRYYSSATSTLMAVSAVFHGNDFELDSVKSYNLTSIKKPHSENIFKILRANGYETKPFIYTHPALSEEFFSANIYDDGFAKDGRIFDFDEFFSSIDTFFEANKNGRLAAFIDYEPTHCGINDAETSKIPVFEQKTKFAYITLNKVVGHIWESLREKGLLDKTIIVIYGDHGDDKWSRCINNGFSHFTEPYLSSVSTPLAIYDSRLSNVYIDDIISGTDIKPTILYMLGIRNPDTFEHSGINIFEAENDCVYSSSMFANQCEYETIEAFDMAKLNGFNTIETKNKSYCAVNESYCLIAGKDGMQLFNTASDPLNYNNLLSFYELDENGRAVRFNNYNAWRGHFRIEIMADGQIYECLRNFYSLAAKLKERIRTKESYVKNIENGFDFGAFERVRKRGFI